MDDFERCGKCFEVMEMLQAQLEKVRELSYQSGMSVDNNKLQAILENDDEKKV